MRLLVVGAGPAGLSTAKVAREQLAELPEGVEVVVVEAGDRVGGALVATPPMVSEP